MQLCATLLARFISARADLRLSLFPRFTFLRFNASLCYYRFIAAFCTLIGLNAAEPWADPRLPVKNGLEVWLDATQENAARQSKGLPRLANGSALSLWHDGSGNGQHLAQPIPTARPHFKLTSGTAVIDFDGKDDFLSASNLRRSFTNATVFIFAAPRANPGFFRAFMAINQSGRNDYQTGFNIDLGPSGSSRFDTLNPEGS